MATNLSNILVNGVSSPINLNCNALFINQQTKQVGINTSNPAYTLDVSGTLNVNGSLLPSTSANSIAIGYQAGQTSQATNAIAIGWQAGQSNQGSNAISLGYQTSLSNQGSNAISLGAFSGQINQGNYALAIGCNAGQTGQKDFSVAIGTNAGATNVGTGSVCLGVGNGASNFGNYNVSMGCNTFYNAPYGDYKVNIGLHAGASDGNSASNTVAIGTRSGQCNQKVGAVNININVAAPSATFGPGTGNVSIGYTAGHGAYQTVAIGTNAGFNNLVNSNAIQATYAIAIGYFAGSLTQGTQSIAIGYLAGQSNQAKASIAIGTNAGVTSQNSNTIILNATGSVLNTATASACYINPIRTAVGTATGALSWDSTTGKVAQYSGKTFVIDHPEDDEKYLVHACIEGPESAVYYRGSSEITENKCVEVILPEYIEKLAKDFIVHVSPVYEDCEEVDRSLFVSDIVDGRFKVYGENGEFDWLVVGKRNDIEIEPLKNNILLKGQGPYTYF